MAFKQYARVAEEIPDPGVSVQLTNDEEEDTIKLFFVRQAVERNDNWPEPIGAVVCEFTFPLHRTRAAEWELWSFEYARFERLVDLVEQQPEFADLMVKRPLRSAVYWQDA